VPSSLRQLGSAVADAGREIEIAEIFVGEAFRALRSGDQATHDRLLLEAIEAHQDRVDVIVMAQLSMAVLEDQIKAARFRVPVLNPGGRGSLARGRCWSRCSTACTLVGNWDLATGPLGRIMATDDCHFGQHTVREGRPL